MESYDWCTGISTGGGIRAVLSPGGEEGGEGLSFYAQVPWLNSRYIIHLHGVRSVK